MDNARQINVNNFVQLAIVYSNKYLARLSTQSKQFDKVKKLVVGKNIKANALGIPNMKVTFPAIFKDEEQNEF